MKTFLKYSGFLAAVIAVVGFILMMTTPAFAYFPKDGDPLYLSGNRVLFGEDTALGHIDAVWTAVLGWILAMVGLIALIIGVLLHFSNSTNSLGSSISSLFALWCSAASSSSFLSHAK